MWNANHPKGLANQFFFFHQQVWLVTMVLFWASLDKTPTRGDSNQTELGIFGSAAAEVTKWSPLFCFDDWTSRGPSSGVWEAPFKRSPFGETYTTCSATNKSFKDWQDHFRFSWTNTLPIKPAVHQWALRFELLIVSHSRNYRTCKKQAKQLNLHSFLQQIAMQLLLGLAAVIIAFWTEMIKWCMQRSWEGHI